MRVHPKLGAIAFFAVASAYPTDTDARVTRLEKKVEQLLLFQHDAAQLGVRQQWGFVKNIVNNGAGEVVGGLIKGAVNKGLKKLPKSMDLPIGRFDPAPLTLPAVKPFCDEKSTIDFATSPTTLGGINTLSVAGLDTKVDVSKGTVAITGTIDVGALTLTGSADLDGDICK